MNNNICYKSPFLKEVIFRVDFPFPLEMISKRIPKELDAEIKKRFPILEPQKTQTKEFQISGSSVHTKDSEATQWVYFGTEREKSLTLAPDAFLLKVQSYISYQELKKDILGSLEMLFRKVPDVSSSRIGLRYINIINIKESDPLSWGQYINEEMLGIIDFHEEKDFLTRVFHIVEFNFDGLRVKFQFGVANPDYPARIRAKQFVLDIDGYSHGSFDFGDIHELLDGAHSKIQQIFESSITDELRAKMESAE